MKGLSYLVLRKRERKETKRQSTGQPTMLTRQTGTDTHTHTHREFVVCVCM